MLWRYCFNTFPLLSMRSHEQQFMEQDAENNVSRWRSGDLRIRRWRQPAIHERNKKGTSTNYIRKIHYNEQGKRSLIVYGNGVKTQ